VAGESAEWAVSETPGEPWHQKAPNTLSEPSLMSSAKQDERAVAGQSADEPE